MKNDSDLLVGLSTGELEALSDCLLAPAAQVRLDFLLSRNAEQRFEPVENAELDQLLDRVDQLTILKTRAKYTLQQLQAEAGVSRE